MSERDLVDGITTALRAEAPGLDDPRTEVVRRVSRFATKLDDALADCLAPWGLTRADYGVLITLRAAGEPFALRPSELKSRLLMTSGGVSGVINRLERTGLVERQPDPSDGRGAVVCLTTKGADTAIEALRAWTEIQCDLLRNVSDAVSRNAADGLRNVMLALGDVEPRA
jgi:DNA-binding MarR family transcriptional regulator